MKKLIKSVFVLVLCLVVFSANTVFAVDPASVFTMFFECTGKVYFCDPNLKTVVIKNVEYSGDDEEIKSDIFYNIEYTEIPIFMGGISAVGRGKISGEIVNSEYADAEVKLVIAKNVLGYKVIHMMCGEK